MTHSPATLSSSNALLFAPRFRKDFIYSLVAEATVKCVAFSFHPHFDVSSLLSTAVLSSGTSARFANFSLVTNGSLSSFAADPLPWTLHTHVKF